MDWNTDTIAWTVIPGGIAILGAVLGVIGLVRTPKGRIRTMVDGPHWLTVILERANSTGTLKNVTIGVMNVKENGDLDSGDWVTSWAPEIAAGEIRVCEFSDPAEVVRMDPAPRPHEQWRTLPDNCGVLVWIAWEQHPLLWQAHRFIRWDAGMRRRAAQPEVLKGQAARRAATAVTKRLNQRRA